MQKFDSKHLWNKMIDDQSVSITSVQEFADALGDDDKYTLYSYTLKYAKNNENWEDCLDFLEQVWVDWCSYGGKYFLKEICDIVVQSYPDRWNMNHDDNE